MKCKRQSKNKASNKVMEIDMMRIDPGAIGFTSGFSQEHNTTRENPSSSAGFVLTSSAGRHATNKALQLLLSSNACPHALLLGQIAAAFVHSHATANVTTVSVFSLHRY